MATLVEGDPKASFSIATTPRCKGGRYSISKIAPHMSLVWLDLGLNPSLPDYWRTLLIRPMAPVPDEYSSAQCVKNKFYWLFFLIFWRSLIYIYIYIYKHLGIFKIKVVTCFWIMFAETIIYTPFFKISCVLVNLFIENTRRSLTFFKITIQIWNFINPALDSMWVLIFLLLIKFLIVFEELATVDLKCLKKIRP